MKKILSPILLTLFLFTHLQSDAFNELDSQFKDQDNDFKNFKEKVDSDFSNFKKSIDDEFSAFLKQTWKEFEALKSEKPYEKPKPKKTPVLKKIVKIDKNEIKKSPIVKIVEKPKEKIKEKAKPKIDKSQKKVSFDFYGEKININYDKSILFNLDKVNNKTISKAWQKLSHAKLSSTKKQILEYISFLNLNDWAKFLLIKQTGDSIYKNENKANIFTWHILVKLGFDMKVGYNNNEVYLLSSIKHKLYKVPFFNINSKRYYLLSKEPKSVGRLSTYKGNYPKANETLSFEVDKPIKFETNIKTKKLSFKFNGKSYTVNAKYSKDLVDFYRSVPQSDYKIYLDSKSSIELNESTLKELKKYLKGMSELEAVNFLLRFTQKSFAYKTDQDQFSREKVMFPDETIFYPYSDCEDRSIMFTSLVKNLLGLDVVALKFPDHLATAVALSSKVHGDSFKYKGKRYTIADPTYINANVGMRMPQYKNVKFSVIK